MDISYGYMATETNSITVLRTIYDEEIVFDKPPHKDEDQIKFINHRTGIPEDELEKALTYLYKIGLVESTEYGGPGKPFGLSEKGFEVLHDREMGEQKREHEEALREQQQEHLEELRRQQRKHDEEVAERQMEVTKETGKYTLYLVLAVSLQAVSASLNISGWQGAVLGLVSFLIILMVSIELLKE